MSADCPKDGGFRLCRGQGAGIIMRLPAKTGAEGEGDIHGGR